MGLLRFRQHTHMCFLAADIISTVEFDHTGNYLATGDKGGRVVLFERNETVSLGAKPYSSPLPNFCRLADTPYRRRPANTSSTPNSSPTSRSLTISNHWKLRRRSTRSSGAGDRMLPTSFCRPMIKPSSCGRCLRSR